MTRLEFKTTNWSGPGGTAFQQGVKWGGKDFYVYQSNKIAGREDVIIRRYSGDLTYKGYQTIAGPGGDFHASTTGVIQLTDTISRHILPAYGRGICLVDYEVGNAASPKKTYLPNAGYASAVSCNNSAGILSVRKGGSKQTVTWLDRDKILSGGKSEDLLKYSFATPKGATFQGHYSFGDSDYFAWETDDVTRGSKNYRCWADRWKNGKKVATLDTTALIARTCEPEGFMGYMNQLFVVKKMFGKGRHLVAVSVNI